jgi:hypothetical protein
MVLFVVAWMHLKCYFLISENKREIEQKTSDRVNGCSEGNPYEET